MPDPMSETSSSAYDARALAVLPGGTTRGLTAMIPLLPRAVYGEGYEVVGERGQRWIDLNNNFTSLIHGHAHRDVVKAAAQALAAGPSFGMSTTAEIELAELLVDRVSWATQVRFCNSGTEAVMAAVRAARSLTGRDKIMVPMPSYHGSADHVLPALGGSALNGVPNGVRDDTLVVEPGDISALEAAFAAHGSEVAALVLDLVPSRAGARPVSSEFLRRARELTTSVGAMLIVDEVVTFRHDFAGMTAGHFGVQADLLAVGKIMGGGFPVGAVLGTAEAMAVLDPRHGSTIFHGGTFSGNPVSMRAGIAAMELYDEAAVARLNDLGDCLRTAISDDAEQLGWNITGFGSIVKIVHDTAAVPSDWPVRLWWAAERRGLLIVPGTMSMCLSTPMDRGVVDTVADRILDALREVTQ